MEIWDWDLKFYIVKNKYLKFKNKNFKMVSKSIFELQKENLKKKLKKNSKKV